MFLDFSIRTFKSPKIASELGLPVSANSYTGVLNSYTGVWELVYRCLRTRIPVSVNSYTGVCELVYSHPSIRFHKHRYTSSRHRYTSSQTPEARVLVFKGHFQVYRDHTFKNQC